MEVNDMVPDEFAVALLQHCYNEFTFLSRFLPSLFIAEKRRTHAVKPTWKAQRPGLLPSFACRRWTLNPLA
jgi:hypothetical protein